MTDNDLEFEKKSLKSSDLEWDFRLGGLSTVCMAYVQILKVGSMSTSSCILGICTPRFIKLHFSSKAILLKNPAKADLE